MLMGGGALAVILPCASILCLEVFALDPVGRWGGGSVMLMGRDGRGCTRGDLALRPPCDLKYSRWILFGGEGKSWRS